MMLPPRERNLVPHKLPPDILYLIAEFASFEERAKLVRCNKWLYRICHPLLFRDIYLHTPKQLVNLWGNTKAMHMLGKTQSVLIGEVIFMPHTWGGIQVSLHPADYLIQVLGASTSLLRLQIIPDATTDPGSYWHPKNFEFRDDFEQRLRSQASNSEFLPKLSVIVDRSEYINLEEFRDERPTVLYASLNSHCVFVHVRASACPGSPEQPLARNPSTSSTLSQPVRPTYQNFSATDFGRFIYESMAGPYPLIATTLGILSTRIDESSNTQPTHEDTLSWLCTMVSAAKLTYIENLLANIEPMCPSQPLAAQYAVIERLRRLLPRLTSAKILRDSVEWRRSTTKSDKAQSSNLPLSIWTPRPDLRYPGVLEWWVAALGLDISGAQDHELRDKVRLLHNAMSTRWENRWVPSEDKMYEHLLALE